MSRVKRVADRRAMERTTDEYITRGYRLMSEGGTSTRLKERDWGDSGMHVFIALFTGWWTLGFFNALYAVYSYATAEEILITIEDEQEPGGPEEWEWGSDPEERQQDSPPDETEQDSVRDDGPRDSALNEREFHPDPKGKEPNSELNDGAGHWRDQGPSGPNGGVGRGANDIRDGGLDTDSDGSQSAGGHERAGEVRSSDTRTALRVLRYGLLQLVSLFTAGLVLLSIFCFYTGLVGRSIAVLALPTLATAVALRYVAIYHPFSTVRYRRIAVVPVLVAFAATGTVWVARLQSSIAPGEIERVLRNDTVQFGSTHFLPRWWVGCILVVAGLTLLLGSLRTRDFSTYPWPDSLRQVATSPVLFGLVCTFFGLWSVLFVGISIQRVLVFAPIFEELLKFGVAILIGSALFGRSMLARVGVAIVVGALFGLVEHATTYPMESDTVYLFRILLHATLTVLSVSVYTAFDDQGQDGYRWIAPAYSILLHFTYNAFAVISSIIGVVVFGIQSTTVVLVYGAGAIAIAIVILGLVAARRSALVAIYTPLHETLSDVR